jgi:predicted ATP-binding protein involved in virulence
MNNQTQAESLLAYFKTKRAANVERYKAARLWCDRKTARQQVLHYGRLCRKFPAHPT